MAGISSLGKEFAALLALPTTISGPRLHQRAEGQKPASQDRPGQKHALATRPAKRPVLPALAGKRRRAAPSRFR